MILDSFDLDLGFSCFFRIAFRYTWPLGTALGLLSLIIGPFRHTWPIWTFLVWLGWLAWLHGFWAPLLFIGLFLFYFILFLSFSFMIIIHFLLVISLNLFIYLLFIFVYLFIYFYRFLIYLLAYLFIQLFNFKNFMFLQGNLLLEFKEGGTLLGRFWRGIWNWEDLWKI